MDTTPNSIPPEIVHPEIMERINDGVTRLLHMQAVMNAAVIGLQELGGDNTLLDRKLKDQLAQTEHTLSQVTKGFQQISHFLAYRLENHEAAYTDLSIP